MPKRTSKSARSGSSESELDAEQENLLASLRAHGQVREAESADVPLGPGETHVYVKKPGEKTGRLLEVRKSFFKR